MTDAKKSKRQDILDAAIVLFAERGYNGTTVPMIADAAKVGAGTIYRYFDHKENLVNVLFQEKLNALFEQLLKDYPTDASIREQFHHIFESIHHFAMGDTHALHFIDSHCNEMFLTEESQELFDSFIEYISNVVRVGQERGEIIVLQTEALIGIVYGAIVQILKMVRAGTIDGSSPLMDNLEECCWNAIKAN
ncbi:TetR/AcrR family transcriptional regulator [Cytobacillus sp. FSL R5-0569]|uniref:TetR/AcrR family transcriptional regulator n=1 Tax=Cytobacillus TaxID=2675230 RepID=UPI002785691C|nr:MULTISPECIES: TetR/AcrR family transcriptional regulator [Cytobacillus]MDQ0186890.1 AcrR family transcriptional regulator [Cytobacillus kochii]MEA1855490.1 TetR/AcrR family transcriptional regulator [Cytobacillus sp. OWB-43]